MFSPVQIELSIQTGLDPLIMLLVALMVDAYVGDFTFLSRYVKHPVAWLGDIVGSLDRKLNRKKRGDLDRLVRGVIVVVFVICLTGLLSVGVAWLTILHPWGWVLEFVLTITLLAGRGLYDHVLAVADGLNDSVEAGRDAVRHIVGREPSDLDKHGVARAGIESLAENFSDGVIAPVFWYILFGFPGMAIYKAVNTMDSMIGHNTARYKYFGMAAARLDDVLNLVPARLTGVVIIIAALFTPGAYPVSALKVMLRDSSKHRSPNAGWAEAPMAGALGLALAGPRQYGGQSYNDPWIGEGRARATAHDMHRALFLYIIANLVNVGLISVFIISRGNLF